MAGKPKRVLVVEDDCNFRNILVRTLTRSGYHAIPAKDFASAISIIETEEQLDLLLLDIRMPAGTPNGVTLGRMAGVRRKRLPIVYMTGAYNMALLSGVLGSQTPILQKPFKLEDLVETIKTAINQPPAS